ncbi:hypothetical protein CRP01_08890 [Flavilitoribacter nigricans DSM 23189 = NBRC 102662]|uniref:Uncharacterized protein n=1 Tax=Flavilitoribacter nigricans (strain ATCC 23147 / DSM 23189 / NBRC 102662 / NCIMB 1420 / SS-2) TaxID=1122177 RepID=A0A2D0NEJ7_FLAN2|nr:hypothetical protein CRP01_08890 [Flavilitoribacter nigricans DSM 23189 = NBRC 102662]
MVITTKVTDILIEIEIQVFILNWCLFGKKIELIWYRSDVLLRVFVCRSKKDNHKIFIEKAGRPATSIFLLVPLNSVRI